MSDSHEQKSVPLTLLGSLGDTIFYGFLYMVLLPYLAKVLDSIGPATALSMAAFLLCLLVWLATVRCKSKSRGWMWFLALWCVIQVGIWVLQAQGKDPNEIMKTWAPLRPHATEGVKNNLEGSVEKPVGTSSSAPKVKDGAQPDVASPTTATPSKPSPPPLEKVPYEGKDTKSLSIEDDE